MNDEKDDIQAPSMFNDSLPYNLRGQTNYVNNKILGFEPVDEVMTEED